MVNLSFTGRHFFPGAAIDDFYTLGTEAHGGTGRVHSHVAGSENDHIFANRDGRINFRIQISLHEIGSGKILIRGKYTDEIFTGDVHESWQAGTDSNIDGVVSFLEQFIQGHCSADYGIALHVNAESLKKIDFLGDNGLWQTKLRDSVYQNTTWFMECFIDGYIMTFGDEIAGDRET